MRKRKLKIIVIVGPTASGKSEFGVQLARKISGEIISADSRQIYKGLDVGSGKVRGKWQKIKKSKSFIYKGVQHHCIDIANPKRIFTAADFVECGWRALANIMSRGKTPIIVGGTGFYIDALMGRAQLAPVPPNPLLRKKLGKKSTAQLFAILKKLDSVRAKTIDSKNPRRLIRAIEIICSTKQKGFSLSSLAPAGSKPVQSSSVLWLGIQRSPEDLKRRVHKRLIARLPGIVREVKKLHRQKVSWKRLYDFGLEYRYVSLYVQGKTNYQLMTTRLQTAIWHYARRQMTWFKRNKQIRWINRARLSRVS